MGNSSLKSIKSQSLIEATMMMVAGIVFLLGAFRVGLWYNQEVSERQPAYQNTRVEAGSDNIGVWPIHARRDLTDEWVLQGGDFPPKGTFTNDGGSTGRTRDTDCQQDAEDKENQAEQNYKDAYNLRVAASELEVEAAEDKVTADYWKGEYDTCMASCWYYYCDCSYQQSQWDYYQGESDRKYAQADQMRQDADDLEDDADVLFEEAGQIRQDCWKMKQ